MKDRSRYLITRFIELFLTLFVVSFITFLAFSVIPGDTARIILGTNATEAQVIKLREELGLDLPIHTQYLNWIGGVFRGDLGKSVAFGKPVAELIATRLPVTLGMSFFALIIVLAVSYPISIVCSRKPGQLADQILSVISHTIFAIPPFVLSMLIILFASEVFGFFYVGKYTKPSEDFGEYILCLLLPALCIALPKIAMTFKFLRSSIIEERASDYVKTAKSHGLSDFKIMLTHIIPNSNVSTITVISLVLSDILGGSLIVEQVFNLPGLGRLLLASISRRDFPLLSGMVLYLALITVALYFLADILTAVIDPRISITGGDQK